MKSAPITSTHCARPASICAGTDRERGQEAGARRADVERARADRAELVRDERRRVRHDLVRGGRGDQHEVDLLGRDPGPPERGRARGRGVGGEPFVRLGDAPRMDPRTADDPLVADADPGGDLGVRDHGLRQARADRRNRGAFGDGRIERLCRQEVAVGSLASSCSCRHVRQCHALIQPTGARNPLRGGLRRNRRNDGRPDG